MAKKGKRKYNFTVKQQRFIDAFKGDVKKAGDIAGISYNYAKDLHTRAHYKHVQEAIREKQKKFQKSLGIDQEWLLKRYKKLSDYKITDFFDDLGNMKPLSEIPEESIYAVCGLDVSRKTEIDKEDVVETFIQKFKLSDKKGALDSIAKVLGLNKEKGGLDLGDEVREVKIIYVGKKDEDRS